MIDNSTIAQVASIIAGFGATMLFFRIQRELEMWSKDEPVWMPWADWLLIWATIIALLGAVFPIVTTLSSSVFVTNLARVSCMVATLLLTGYIPSILAHYRIIFGKRRSGPRGNPEPAERILVILTVVAAVMTTILMISGMV
jgi:hypothetical protein